MRQPDPRHNGATPDPSPQPSALAADVDGLVAEVHATVARRLTDLLPPDRLLALSEDDHAHIGAIITEAVAEVERGRVLAGAPALGPHGREQLSQGVYDALLRLGPLQRHLADPQVEDLLIDGHTSAAVIRADGTRHPIPSGFASEAELRSFAARTVAGLGRRLDEASPWADACLPDGSRLHAICPPLTPSTCVTIRRHRPIASSLPELIALGTLTPQVADLLAAAVGAGLNLLISGGTAAGKTTLLNALLAELPSERVICIEETRELEVRHPAIALQARFGNVEGIGEVTQRELVRNALRMRPDRIVLGEVRGPEALDMLHAMTTGHDGSVGTIHANTARQALAKLRLYVMWAEAGLSGAVVDELIAETIDWVLQLHKAPGGRRVLAEVVELAGVEAAADDQRHLLLTNRLTALDARGRPVVTGLRSRHADRLAAAGWVPGGEPAYG